MGNGVDGIPARLNDQKSKYKAFLKLYCRQYDQNDCNENLLQTQKLFTLLLASSRIKLLFDCVEKERFLQHLLMHHFIVVLKNSYKDVDNRIGIAPIACLFNHSCAPNAFVGTVDNQIVSITTRPVKKGEQIFFSYIAEQFNNSTADRRDYLLKTFGFICECDKCEPNYHPDNRARMTVDSSFDRICRSKMPTMIEEQIIVEFLQRYGNFGNWCEPLDLVLLCYMMWLNNHLKNDIGPSTIYKK